MERPAQRSSRRYTRTALSGIKDAQANANSGNNIN